MSRGQGIKVSEKLNQTRDNWETVMIGRAKEGRDWRVEKGQSKKR
jgi:hypothetical protein